MSLFTALIVISCLQVVINSADPAVPVVFWHGMGDTCCNPLSLGTLINLVENRTGSFVHSIRKGEGFVSDFFGGYLGNINEDIERACKEIAGISELQNGYNAIGLSQGGQFLRAVAQRCPTPPMKKLISIGGQQQGVYGLPRCNPETFPFCDTARKAIGRFIYQSPLQTGLIQAQYWHDPFHKEEYVSQSGFLAEINNEPPHNHTHYKENLMRLDRLVLVKFAKDSMVVPRDSCHFAFYAARSGTDVVPFRETHLYVEDRIGLRALDQLGKVDLLEAPGDHLEFSDKWFHEEILQKYLMA